FLRLEVEAQAPGPAVEDIGADPGFGDGVQALDDAPGVEGHAAGLEEGRGFTELLRTGYCFGKVVPAAHPGIALVGLEDDTQSVRLERFTDGSRATVIVETPDP